MKTKFKKYTIDFSNVNYYLEMHAVIRDSLGFPAFYGCNWDAFWDCLREISGEPVHILIRGLEIIQDKKFGNEADIFIDILKEFKHYENDKFANITIIEVEDTDTGKITSIL
ncbi:MAG: barstar family protein [Clostridia bacterium]|nr:barstar family protein [Clostridia bacterium]